MNEMTTAGTIFCWIKMDLDRFEQCKIDGGALYICADRQTFDDLSTVALSARNTITAAERKRELAPTNSPE